MFRITAVFIAMLASPVLSAIAQDAPTPAPALSTTTGQHLFDEAGYRKFDEVTQFFRSRSAKEYAIDTAKGIDEASFVPIGGIQQWVKIRGADRNNPVLLFVHGGPGDVTTRWSLPYFLAWEKRFTVVQWDERGAGKTFGKSGPSIGPTMTPERMAQDGVELTEYLCKHLGKRKVILVAHSFGTILGLQMIQLRPDLYFAYVGTGQAADETQSYTVAYSALLAEARATGNQQALDELNGIGPPPYPAGNGFQVQRKWSNRFEGADKFLPSTIGLSFQAPGDTVQDLVDTLQGELFSADHLVPQLHSRTMKDLGLRFAVPMFFFEGTKDFTTPTELARKYLNAIQAPRKEFVPIPGGHFAVFINGDKFLEELVARVLPLATAAR